MRRLLLLLFFALLTACIPIENQPITSFEECRAAGNPVMESYPMQCRATDGQTFVQDIGNELEKMDMIRVTDPRPGDVISIQTVVFGEARGTWFFEGDFPVIVEDDEGNVLFTTYATAQGEWMTEDFVTFTANLEEADFSQAQKGTLVLQKDNPSGLPENDDELRVPVRFD